MRTVAHASVVVLLLVLVGCCRPEVMATQPVALRPQETGMWCWAASGEMAMDFLGTDVTQCDQANRRFGRTDCCNNPVPNACVNGGWPEFAKYGFNSEHTSDAPLSWEQVRSEIYCAKRPFAFSWHWSGGGGHMMIVRGYVTLEGTNYVYVNDPWAPNVGDQRIIPYDAYVSGAGYTHWDDYFRIARQ